MNPREEQWIVIGRSFPSLTEVLSRPEGRMAFVCAVNAIVTSRPAADESAKPTERAAFETKFPVPSGVKWDGKKYAVDDEYVNSYVCDRFIGRWDAWQAANTASKEVVPVAWRYTLIMEGGQTQIRTQPVPIDPFGVAGEDYDESYRVACEPLYSHPATVASKEALTMSDNAAFEYAQQFTRFPQKHKGEDWCIGFMSITDLGNFARAIKAHNIDESYWLSNRANIIEAISAAGFELLSNKNGWWLAQRDASKAEPTS